MPQTRQPNSCGAFSSMARRQLRGFLAIGCVCDTAARKKGEEVEVELVDEVGIALSRQMALEGAEQAVADLRGEFPHDAELERIQSQLRVLSDRAAARHLDALIAEQAGADRVLATR
jgi:hypothetical protein